MKKILRNCLKKRKRTSVRTPIYEENYHFRNREDLINEIENKHFIFERRIINMCNRWKIRRDDAKELIYIVDSQQTL